MTEKKDPTTNSARRFVFIAQWRFSEMLALALICALGALILVIHLATWGAQTRREAKFCVPVPCVVDSVAARPETDKTGVETLYRPEVTISYEFEGESYTGVAYDRTTLTDDQGFSYTLAEAEKALAPFPPGCENLCWIRQDAPTQVILVKTPSFWGWVFLFIPTLIIISGASLLISRLYDRAFSEEEKANSKRRKTQYPTLPQRIDRPLARGAVKNLSPDARTRFASVVGAVGAILWNVAAWTIAVYVAKVAETTGDKIAAAIFILIFCGTGLLFACRLWTRRRIERAVGTMAITVNAFPIQPGRRVNVELTLKGPARAKRFDVALQCVEVARFAQGTNTVAHHKEIYDSTLMTRFDVDVSSKAETTERFSFVVPIGAMHSFQSEHNEIIWKLVARMELCDGGVFARDYELVVMPFAPKD